MSPVLVNVHFYCRVFIVTVIPYLSLGPIRFFARCLFSLASLATSIIVVIVWWCVCGTKVLTNEILLPSCVQSLSFRLRRRRRVYFYSVAHAAHRQCPGGLVQWKSERNNSFFYHNKHSCDTKRLEYLNPFHFIWIWIYRRRTLSSMLCMCRARRIVLALHHFMSRRMDIKLYNPIINSYK